MSQAAGICHSKRFISIHHGNELPIGERTTGFTIGNVEYLGEGFLKLERSRRGEWRGGVIVTDDHGARPHDDRISMRTTAAHSGGVQAIDDHGGGQPRN